MKAIRRSSNSETFSLTESGNRPSTETALFEPGYRKFPAWSLKRCLILLIVAAVLIALALGLGLGLGLRRSGGSKPVGPRGKWLDEPCRAPGVSSCPAGYSSSSVLLISLDGFRAEYLLRNLTPVIGRLSHCGVHVPYMRATFPTKTFPNHYTIVTGLYPESHGIVGNKMYDPTIGREFSLGDKDGRWWGGDPIWLTAKRQGKKTATFFWPGSDVKIKGDSPTYWKPYNRSIPFEKRVDTILGWLDLPKDRRPEFMTMYMEEPDSLGHKMAPYEKVTPALQRVDSMIGRLMDGLLHRNLHNCLNVIILADHGMEESSCSKQVVLNNYVNLTDYYIIGGAYGSITSKIVKKNGQIIPNKNPVSIEKTLSDLECKDDHMNVFEKTTFPLRHHYSNSRRINDVTLDMTNKWIVNSVKRGKWCNGGSHGWDEVYQSMHALFTAHGPAFKANLRANSFSNIEVYNLISEVLGITPSPNNGTSGSLRHLLHTSKPFPTTPPSVGIQLNYTFPKQDDYLERVNLTNCQCSITEFTNKTLREVDAQLNLTDSEKKKSQALHLPHGQLGLDFTDVKVSQLTQQDYITGYSINHHMPLWSAFTVTKKISSVTLYNKSAECVRGDVRLPNSVQTNCSDYEDSSQGIFPTYLYPPEFSISGTQNLDARIATNIVSMFKDFRKDIWMETLNLIQEYADKYQQLHVVIGAAFDQKVDGLKDSVSQINRFVNNGSVPVPTHFYVVMTKCTDSSTPQNSCREGNDVVSFILPHLSRLPNCMKASNFLKDNAARVRDVELLTGLRFITSMKDELSVSLKTYLPDPVWERKSWMDDKTCGSAKPQCPAGFDEKSLLLISLDGFRAAYLNRGLTPVLQKMLSCGVHTPYMRSVYPTLTFPNHYTIVTGLYPESHGIVSNSMYDMDLRQAFRLGNANKFNPKWWGGDPLWNVAERQNKTTATCFWPGSDVRIANATPSYWLPYNGNLPFEKRVDQVLTWLDLPAEKRPSFITLYLEQPDKAGHSDNPLSIKVDEALEMVDTSIKQLMDGLYKRGLHNCLNILVLADHGMSEISCNRVVLLEKYQDLSNLYVYGGATGRISNKYRYKSGQYIHLNESQQVPVKTIIKNLECKTEGKLDVYETQNLMKRYHYSDNKRIEDIVLDMHDEWLVYRYNSTGLFCEGGQHGFDPVYQNMQALFLAHGPAFKKNFTVQPFENIELYNIMAEVLNITVGPNNGTQGSLNHMLRESPPLSKTSSKQEYKNGSFPDLELYKERANNSDCECSPPENGGGVGLWEYDSRLNLTEEQAVTAVNTHLPTGLPRLLFTKHQDEISLLPHEDYVTAYSHSMRMPLWTAYKLQKKQVENSQKVPKCMRPDVRLDSSDQLNCSDWDAVKMEPVMSFNPEISSSGTAVMDALIMSNVVPMLTSFKSGIWSSLMELIRNWTTKYENLYIITGPILDHNADGLRDSETIFINDTSIPLVSHYYIVIMKCKTTSVPAGACVQYDTFSVILQHSNEIPNCMGMDAYLAKNVARLRDIELLSGIQFFTQQEDHSTIQMRTFLPTEIWPVK